MKFYTGMNIANFSPIRTLKNNFSTIRTTSPLSFRGVDCCGCDVFERQAKTKNVLIQDIKGNPVEAVIVEEMPEDKLKLYGKNPKKFTINVNDKQLGYAILYDSKDKGSVYLKELYTEENLRRHYKNAGTELLKCVVAESKKRGFGGAVILTASNSPPPFVFYYKNNFKVSYDISCYNAAIDYAAKNNIPVYRILPDTLSALPMELDENGAVAFLRGERLYEKRNTSIILEKTAGDCKFQANYIESPYKNENYFQVLDLNSKHNKQCFVARVKKEQDNGNEYLKLMDVDDCYCYGSSKTFTKTAIKALEQKLGLRVVVTEEYSK